MLVLQVAIKRYFALYSLARFSRSACKYPGAKVTLPPMIKPIKSLNSSRVDIKNSIPEYSPNELYLLISNNQNPLKQYSPIENVKVHSILCSSGLLNRMLLNDWHRLFENITIPNWKTETIPSELISHALELLVSMKRCGVTPDAFVYSTLYKMTSDDLHQVLDIHKHARKLAKSGTSAISNASIISICQILAGKHADYQSDYIIQELWDDVAEFKIKPSKETLIAFLVIKSVRKIPDFVSLLHDRLAQRRSVYNESWNVNVYQALMEYYSKMGHFDAVEKLYGDLKSNSLKISR